MMWGPGEAEQAFDLPPGYTLISLREGGDAFTRSLEIAAQAGAGTLVRVGRYDLVEFAITLEPDEPLMTARRAFFAGMNAVGDAIVANAPPERDVRFTWPDTVLLNGQLLGGARLGWPQDCAEDDVPNWLVFGVMLRAAESTDISIDEMSLTGAGFATVDADALIGSFARHLMTIFDRWEERGFDSIAGDYLARLLDSSAGEARSIEQNGDLLIKARGEGQSERASLLEGLARSNWYDPGRGGPKSG